MRTNRFDRVTLRRCVHIRIAPAIAMIVIATTLSATDSWAATLIWKDPVEGNWTDGSKWCCEMTPPPNSMPRPPAAADTAQINNGGTVQVFQEVQVNAVYLGRFTNSSGTVEVHPGGKVTSGPSTVELGIRAPGSAGTIRLIEGGQWVNNSTMYIGFEGNGTVEIKGGTLQTSQNFLSFDGPYVLGAVAGAMGTVTVEDSNSIDGLLTTDRDIFVGRRGTGLLNIQGGGEVHSRDLTIGDNASSTGNMVAVDGANSKLVISRDLRVGGSSGTGTLSIRNGGFASTGGFTSFVAAGSVATVENGTWTNAIRLTIFGGTVNQLGTGRIVVTSDTNAAPAGDGMLVGTTGGSGTLVINQGGKLFSTKGRVSGQPGTLATVDGLGSQWNVTEDLWVGVGQEGTEGALSLGTGGTVTAAKEVIVGSRGVLSGTGKITAPKTRNFGTVALNQVRSNWPGSVLPRDGVTQYNANLLIEGDFVQVGRFGDEAGGRIALKGISSSHRLQPGATFSTAMVVTGKAELAGELSVEFATNYKPAIGDRYAVLAANEIAGKVDFKSAILPGVNDRFLGVNYRRNREGGDEPVLEVITLAAPKRVFDPLPNTPPFDERKNLLLVTHGTNDNADEWVKLLAQTMSVDSHRIDAERAAQWDIVAFDWSPFNGGDTDLFDQVVSGLGIDPYTAGSNAVNIGESLARWYKEQPNGGRKFETVHLLAHSAGSWLIDAFADDAAPIPSLPGFPSLAEKVHLTFFDAYTPETTQNTVVGSILEQSSLAEPTTLGPDDLADHADFAEHYFHRSNAVPDTDEKLQHALNVDLTQLWDAGINPPGLSHSYPYRWYTQTADLTFNDPTDIDGWGAAISQLYQGNFPEYKDNFLKGSLWRLSVENGAELVEEAVEPVNLNDAVNVTTGEVEVTDEQTTLETQSPAILTSLIDLQRPFEAFEFDFEFLSENAGLFSVYFDGKQVFGFENAPLGLGPGDELSSDWVWLGKEYAAGPYSITFRLDPLTDQQTSLALSNLQFIDLVRVPTAPNLPGDFNADGTVDTADYLVWRDTLGQMAAGLAADGDGNGMIDAADYDLWRANFGRTAANANGSSLDRSGISPAIPEPTSQVLLMLATAVGGARLRRRRNPGGHDRVQER